MTARSLIVAILLVASPASAQIDRSGPRLGGHVLASGLTIDFEDLEETGTGAGAGVELGYGVSASLSVNVSASGSLLRPPSGDAYGLQTASLGARYNVRPSADFTPYLVVGATLLRAGFDIPNAPDDREVTGTGAFGGVGLEYGLSRRFAADLRVTGHLGTFSRSTEAGVSTDIDLDFRVIRLGAGVTATF